MAVALYTGCLTQFFLGGWIEDLPADEVVADGREAEADAVAADGLEPREALAFFEGLRDRLGEQLKPHAKGLAAWPEATEGPRQVAVIETEEYGALMLVAARFAARGKVIAAHNRKRAWSEDAAVRALLLSEKDVEAMHHLVKADTWLPGDFLPIAVATLPYGNVRVGSLAQLRTALEAVAPALEAPDASVAMLPPETFAAARRAFTAFCGIAAAAVESRLPMVADV